MNIDCLNCDEPLLRNVNLGEIRPMAINIEIRITCEKCWKTSAFPNMELAYEVFDLAGSRVVVYGCHDVESATDMARRLYDMADVIHVARISP